jgi:hypothetical protein
LSSIHPSTPGVQQESSLLPHALAAFDAGLASVAAREDGSKAPVGRWKALQQARLSRECLEREFSRGRTGMGLICGAISGNLEVLEFDVPAVYHEYKERAAACGLAELVRQVEAGYCEQSPSGGVHWLYKCERIGGNVKLAQRLKLPEEMAHPNDRLKTLVETRGNGGFIITAPSYGTVHPTGKPYVLLSGGFDSILTITPEERASLFELARSFDQLPSLVVADQANRKPSNGNIALPGSDFNARGSWSTVLVPHGWEPVYARDSVTYWRRPGKDTGISASTNYADSDLLYVFSSSTPFTQFRGYSKFSAYALLNHDNNYRGASDMLSRLGYGIKVPPKRKPVHHPKVYYSIPEA